jgi:Na+/H+ antiporter NhaD/arsenite permease-like protein
LRVRRRLSARLIFGLLLLLAFAAPAAASEGASTAEHGPELGAVLKLWWAIPFAGILLSIAVFPLAAPRFWHHHYPKVAAAWAVVFALPFLFVYRGAAWLEIVHIYLIDYFPFIILLFGLFTVAGGFVVRGTLRGTPEVNAAMLLIGTALASWIGTTGAAMVLIRPVLRANAQRTHKTHTVIFFIFLVANVGGSLTPLGDPPLFLGFLHSVPFFWTLSLLPEMALVAGSMLVIYYALDRTLYARERQGLPAPAEEMSLSLAGLHNLLFLLGIIGAVLLSGFWRTAPQFTLLGVHLGVQNLVRDGLILAMGALSLVTTRTELRRENDFSWGPIKEVAYLFAGIFMTIIPALAILKAGEQGALAGLVRAVDHPYHYFWATGILSSFLDNAPTYLTFFNFELGRLYPGMPEAEAVRELIATHNIYLEAVATGAVLMGANTYIGNAPNFMVKSIAEEAGVEMPSFFGYIVRWVLPINIPIFILVTLVFFLD